MKLRWLLIPVLLLAPFSLAAQTCTPSGTQLNAATCSEADVNACFSAATSSTTQINIPAGSCNWSSSTAFTVPSGASNFIIKGQTSITFSGSPGTSGYACAVNDGFTSICSSSGSGGTVIIDGAGSGNNLLQIFAAGASSYLTLENLTFEAGTPKNDGVVVVTGPTDNLRLTQFHLVTAASQSGSRFFGQIEGVIDHSVTDLGGNSTSNGFIFSNTIGDAIGYGDGTWGSPTDFGGSDFMFIEDSIINGGLVEDCDTAGKFVVRYSNVLNGSDLSSNIHNHGTKSPSGRGRGCRAYEAYNNYLNCPSCHDNAAIGSGAGPSLVWGNMVTSGSYNNFGDIAAPRNDAEECETVNPGGWGFCGNNIPGGCATPANSNWDGNTNSTGYPCLDGLGRGQNVHPLNGQNFPNAGLNGIGTTPAWPSAYLEPIYYFDNSLGGANEMVLGDISTQLNRDVYIDNASFNGTSGTGTGLLANRPSTCTAGPGGTYGASPTTFVSGTPSYGVAYFATDANSGRGELYVCTSTNVWTGIYEPYTYPHPLDGGSSTCSNPIQSGPNYSGSYNVPPTVLPLAIGFTSPTPGCSMYMTLDGSTPTCSSTAYANQNINATTTLRVIACQSGYVASSVQGGTWTIITAIPAPTGVNAIIFSGP